MYTAGLPAFYKQLRHCYGHTEEQVSVQKSFYCIDNLLEWVAVDY